MRYGERTDESTDTKGIGADMTLGFNVFCVFCHIEGNLRLNIIG